MRKAGTAAFMLALLLIPTYAHAQTSQIVLLDTFGEFNRDEHVFVFGQVSQVVPDLYVIIQMVNPNGDLCHIQQLKPLSDGHFITGSTNLSGSICGIPGTYDVRVFYGDFLNTGSFSLRPERVHVSTDDEYLILATNLVDEKIGSVETEGSIQTSEYRDRMDQIRSTPSSQTAIAQLNALYSDLLSVSFDSSDLFALEPKFRPAIEASLDTTNNMSSSSVIDQEGAKVIRDKVYSAMFYVHLGNDARAIGELNDVYVQITNVDPQKVPSQQTPTYEDLNQLLLGMMTKSNSIMNRDLKEEIGFIFARGTGPIYSNELGMLLDIITKTRTLDTTLRQDDALTLQIRTEWASLRESLLRQNTLEKFIESKDSVDKLFDAAILLRNLDRVDRFVSMDPQPELSALIEPRLNDLMTRLQLASSPDEILSAQQEILDMRNVIEISTRIITTVEFSKTNNADPQLVASFESLLDRIRVVTTLNEVLEVISEFDRTINDLREKRSPLSTLKFEYEKMRTKAELQADYESLVTINNALRAINTAIELEKGNPIVNRMDKIEILLTWASQQQPIVDAKLSSYSKDAHKIRAGDILQRAQSLENLVQLGMTHNRFLPGYVDYVDTVKERLSVSRNLVVGGDLDGADSMVRDLFAEWQQISNRYSEDPFGSDVGYSADEIKRIEYRKKIGAMSDFATHFYNADFAEHVDEFDKLRQEAYDLTAYGNFVDADSKVREMRNFLADRLEMSDRKIIFDISYDPERQIWVMSGAVDKQVMDRREPLYLTVYDMKGDIHSTLRFMDTKHGELYTQWHAPSQPGLYVVLLQYQNNQASQIIDVPEKTVPVFSSSDIRNVDYAREYGELKSFVSTFGGANYQANKASYDAVMNEAEAALNNKDFSTSQAKITELQNLIERYLPNRSRTAVIDANVDNGRLYLSGAIQKTLAFSEDIYIDVFNQRGEKVDEIRLKDSTSGLFNHVSSKNYTSGIYVAQLQYHDLLVSDFFRVR